jgi:hypothetical protein
MQNMMVSGSIVLEQNKHSCTYKPLKRKKRNIAVHIKPLKRNKINIVVHIKPLKGNKINIVVHIKPQ